MPHEGSHPRAAAAPAGRGPNARPVGHDSHGHHAGDVRRVSCAVVTVSDTRTEATDASGALVRDALAAAGHRVAHYRIVPDEPLVVRALVEELAARGDVDAVLLSGGTGIAPRDSTFEAVSLLLTKRIDGFGELFRMLSHREIGSAAMLSRATGGLVGTMALFSMPGSTAACRLAMQELVIPQLAHVVGLARPLAGEHP